MSKTVDVDLRIRAKNLSKSALKDITADVEKLTQAQTEQAKSADLASRSMKELLAEQQRAAALARELASRQNLLKRYADERAEADSLAAKLNELTEVRKRVSSAAATKDVFGVQLQNLDKTIVQTERRMTSFAGKADKTKARLDALGVETADVGKSMEVIASNIQKANGAYDTAAKNVNEYTAAVRHANEVQAEAVRRTREEADARQRAAAANRAAVQAVGGRNAELAALRKDIEERSKQARQMEIAAEAQRRLRVEQEAEASSLVRNNAAVREAVSLLEQRRKRQADLQDVFGRQLSLQEREKAVQDAANARRQRLIALIQSERGQRLLALEAQRRGVQQDRQGAQAKERLATATNRAAKEQAFFADTGRKSLSVYQRIRGQVLGLASAYIGVYQAINTVSNAIDAVNRDQALNIGLRTVNQGDVEKAAKDYKFLRQEADRLGLVFDEVAPKYANMAIAAREVGLSGQETRQLFTDIATSVAAGNLSLDDSEGVFRAIVQIMGKARVQAEELRGQLGDRLPGAVAIFARENNIAITELDDLLKKGELGVEELVKFASGYAKQYAPVMEQATDRLQASMNRARNSYNDWLRDMLNSSNQSKLKEAFNRISQFFDGREGEEFAEALGKAFSALVDVLIWLADNVDLVTKALKIFIAVQLIKFGIDSANAVKGLATQMGGLLTASRGASGELGKAGVAMSRLKLAATGVAAILIGITAALDAQSSALANTTRDLEDYTNLLDRIGRRQGRAKAGTFDEAKQNVADIRSELQDTERQARELQAFIDKYNSGFVGSLTAGLKGTFGMDGLRDLGVGPLSTIPQLQQRVNTLLSQAANLRQSETEELEIQSELLAKELYEQEQAAAAGKDASEAAEESEKERKAREAAEKAAERARLAEERAARAREAAEDAVAKKIIDIQDDIEQAKIQSEFRTAEQIEANYAATLARIELDIQKKRLEMAALQRQSAAAGVDNSTGFTQMDGLLGQLEMAQQARAEEARVTAMVALHQREINDLVSERDDKIKLQNTLMETGQQGALATQQNVNQLQDEYNVKIREGIQALMTFLQTLDPEGELWKRLGLDKVLRDMQQLNVETAKLTNQQKFLNKWGESMAQGFGDAFGALAKGLAGAIQGANSFSDAFKSARDAFLNFAADFLIQIAQMIVQALILQAIQNAISGGSGGYGQAVGNALFGSGHTGGTVSGRGTIGANPRRNVSPLAFAGAERFHEGGLPGLRQGEVAAILKVGEEVVTEDNPRHISNAAAGAATAPGNTTIINSIDSPSVIEAGLPTKAGTQVLVNTMRANRGAIRTALGLQG